MSDRYAQDCDCITHAGPHWLHMDRLDRERTRRMLDQLDPTSPQAPALAGYIAAHEAERLRSKRAHMERAGIDCIPGEVMLAIEEAERQQASANRQQWVAGLKRQIASKEAQLTSLAEEYDAPETSPERKASIRKEIDAVQADLAALPIIAQERAEARPGREER